MSAVKKIATRDSYGNALAELGTEHDNIVVLDADLAAATKTGVFKKAHPDRFIDCGIAESNMIGVAAGLEGYMFANLNVIERLLSIIGGLCLIIPGTVTDLVGIVLVGISAALQMMKKKKAAVA